MQCLNLCSASGFALLRDSISIRIVRKIHFLKMKMLVLPEKCCWLMYTFTWVIRCFLLTSYLWCFFGRFKKNQDFYELFCFNNTLLCVFFSFAPEKVNRLATWPLLAVLCTPVLSPLAVFFLLVLKFYMPPCSARSAGNREASPGGNPGGRRGQGLWWWYGWLRVVFFSLGCAFFSRQQCWKKCAFLHSRLVHITFVSFFNPTPQIKKLHSKTAS